MKSYASVEMKKGNFLKCETENIPIEESKPEDFASKDTVEYYIYAQDYIFDFEGTEEGDILVVEHNGIAITCVYGKDLREKQRRTEIIQKLLGKIQ